LKTAFTAGFKGVFARLSPQGFCGKSAGGNTAVILPVSEMKNQGF